MVLNLIGGVSGVTRLPIVPTNLAFKASSFGGFSSAQAQQTALQQAIAESRAQNPGAFKDPNTGRDYAYVSKVMQPVQIKQPTRITRYTKSPTIPKPIKLSSPLPVAYAQEQRFSQTKLQPRSLGVTERLVGVNRSGQTYNQYTGNVPGQIQDTVLANIAEVGQGTRNIGEDYYNIANLDYKDKSLINRSIGKAFEGDFDEAGQILVSNPQQLAGELLVEIPLLIVPVGPITKAAKAAGIGLKQVAKHLLARPEIIRTVTIAERLNVEKLVDKARPTKADIKKIEKFVVKQDRKIEAQIKKQIKPKYTKRYSKDLKAKNYEKLIKDDTADWAKAPKGTKFTGNVVNINDPSEILKFGGFSKIGKLGKTRKTGKTPLNQKIVDDIIKADWEGASPPKVLSKTAEGQLGKIITKDPFKIGTAKKFITRSEAAKLKSVGIGVGGIAGLTTIGSLPQAEAFPFGAVIKNTAKSIQNLKGTEFQQAIRNMSPNDSRNMYANMFRVGSGLRPMSGTELKGLRTNTLRQSNTKLKQLSKDPVKFKKAVRDYERKNGLPPMSDFDIATKRSFIKNSKTTLTLGGVIAGATASIGSFGMPSAYAMGGKNQPSQPKGNSYFGDPMDIYASLGFNPIPKKNTVQFRDAEMFYKYKPTSKLPPKTQRNLLAEQQAKTKSKEKPKIKVPKILNAKQKLAQALARQKADRKLNELQKQKVKDLKKTTKTRAQVAKEKLLNSSYSKATKDGYITNPYEKLYR